MSRTGPAIMKYYAQCIVHTVTTQQYGVGNIFSYLKKKFPYSQQGCKYLIKHTVKTVLFDLIYYYLFNIITFDQFNASLQKKI